MRIEIDQSGRIEYTGKPTILSFSNGCTFSIIISSSDKQYLQRIYRKAGKSKMLMIKTFSVLVYILIKDRLKSTDDVYIDREYEGYDKLIKQIIIDLYEDNGNAAEKPSLHFANIGKKSRAHFLAINAYRKKKADLKVTSGDVLKFVL